MMRTKTHIGLFGVLFFISVQRNAIAQSQTRFDRLENFGTGSVQTFVAEETGSYIGVSLVLFGHGTANDVTVYVRDLRGDGSLALAVRATGFVPASAISPSTPEWHFVQFDSPISISAGESYGLVLNEFGSGPSGYADFGSSLTNPYSNGRMMYEISPGQPLSPIFPDFDLAFQNNVSVPEPGVCCFVILGGVAFLGLRRSSRRGARRDSL